MVVSVGKPSMFGRPFAAMALGLGATAAIATNASLMWMSKTAIADPLCIGGR
jgi:hypothetical protein